ncbi:uncharacterized protein PAC_02348 [Phialocephala subalpina]|uniref:Zn(2)-C6 fungal-type domain-containing protein n=1 Tax=Phialocephala subalpina TaxID=576137 RepID=A0A1L7WI90_9HELO|nr:uncharacterized protein PAC_02348 [Phialocephala subalpina]
MMTVILGEVQGSQSQGQRQGKSHHAKKSVACNYCRLKKVKCNGEQPTCANCRDRGEKCVYATSRRRSRREGYGNSEAMLERIARLEAMLKEPHSGAAVDSPEEPARHIMAAEGLQMMSNSMQIQEEQEQHLPLSPPHSTESHHSLQWVPTEVSHMAGMCDRGGSEMVVESEGGTDGIGSNGSPNIALGLVGEQDFQESAPLPVPANENVQIDPALKPTADKGLNSIACPENADWEYHGPGSFLSICSKPGIDWVTEKSGSIDFVGIAKTFSRETTRPLKLDRKINPQRAPEPNPETAWKYAKVYFEECPEAAFDVVFRSSFEARLRAHFEDGSNTAHDEDASWYALRNIVYASGCRAELGKATATYSSTFQSAQIGGYKYFENALSRHTELMFCRTGLMAVQALVAMALYSEGIGSPSLEYMLCSGALRLAQSKGLHRQAGSAWGMSPQEIEHRNWIFWMIYTYEKHIAYRSGRASAIDDDDISCHLPTTIPMGSGNNLEYSTYIIKHAQISSQIGKGFGTVQAYRQSPKDIVKTACDLDQQLRDWRDTLPPAVQPGNVINCSELPANLTMMHVLYLHYAYFGSLIAVHSTFTYPWSGMFGRDQSASLRNQINISTTIIAEASRNIILATKYMNDIQAWTPVWLAFYYPVLGLINLFVHVLKHPAAPSSPSDIALMDVVAGHFARLEFASSGDFTFSLGRELSKLARMAVSKSQQAHVSNNQRETNVSNVDGSYLPADQRNYCNSDQGNGSYDETERSNSSNYQNPESFDYAQFDDIDMSDFDMENWSALLPSFSPGGIVNMNGVSGGNGMNVLPD